MTVSPSDFVREYSKKIAASYDYIYVIEFSSVFASSDSDCPLSSYELKDSSGNTAADQVAYNSYYRAIVLDRSTQLLSTTYYLSAVSSGLVSNSIPVKVEIIDCALQTVTV